MSISGSQHQSYDSIRFLGQALQQKLEGAHIIDAYTLSKEEVNILVTQNGMPILLKVITKYQSCFWLVTEGHPLKPSNAQSIFETIWNLAIQKIERHNGNRSFAFVFNPQFQLVFKCYDALANIVLYENETPNEVFRQSITKDAELPLQGAVSGSATSVFQDNAAPFFSICKIENENHPYLFLINKTVGTVLKKGTDILELQTEFAKLCLNHYRFVGEKKSLLQLYSDKQKRIQQVIKQSEAGIRQIQAEVSPEEVANIIMANLSNIKTNTEQVELYDFYRDKQITINLKKDQTAQQQAAYLYRKSKNRKSEMELLAQKLAISTQLLMNINQQLEIIAKATTNKELKPFLPKLKQKEQPFLFRKFELQGFEIWVGKSAQNNDILTTKYAHKDDLWLHAKDVSGSHVVIKHQAGKTYTIQLIEQAAQIAAYYSKLKGSSSVPVSYVLKKFVRKPKGAAPGAVVVEKETIVLVEPKLPQ